MFVGYFVFLIGICDGHGGAFACFWGFFFLEERAVCCAFIVTVCEGLVFVQGIWVRFCLCVGLVLDSIVRFFGANVVGFLAR